MFDLQYVYEKLSEQGKKRVDVFAKFLLDEEVYAEDLNDARYLIEELKSKGYYQNLLNNNFETEQIQEIIKLVDSCLENIGTDEANYYFKNLRLIKKSCEEILAGDETKFESLTNLIGILESSI